MQRTIYSFFKEIVDKYPERKAIIEKDRTLTFSQLDDMVNAIAANSLRRWELLCPTEQIAAMLAVLKSGAFYVPAEPILP